MTLALRTSDVPAASVIASAVEDLTLKLAMRRMSGGVSVITAGRGNDRTGATVTSATALSVEPPTMIVNINRTSSSYPVIQANGHFCVNILSGDHQHIADRFAGKGGLKGADRYHGAEWTTLASGAPVLLGALAAIDCEVEEIIERHSHGIIIGRVVSIVAGDGHSLVYNNGQYGRFLAQL
ncbi:MULTISPECIES: flavin reductase family protein [unclassified Rhizobium]|uniref:flavin reductase family protein n=1 Tax=unclassified Rhizobium TaxID=2613769 RepID=UPI00071576B6|nr:MULTISPECIES: flavin reductase family protein [unclassified Rhizobium]KQS89512.1 flavin reductase [Rhizobium sp. Leaf391]KQS94791.1 flavin reductase [Rhizobium sp. Leaf386]KQU01169.1 flavin reductase [Rhizobium sp. Leaf453]